jgi:hypothetical protein
MKKGMYFDVPDGIIAPLTKECGGNVDDHHFVGVTSGSFENETDRAIHARGHMVTIINGLQ